MVSREERNEKIEYLRNKVAEFEERMETESIRGMPIVGTEAMLKKFRLMLVKEEYVNTSEDELENAGKQ